MGPDGHLKSMNEIKPLKSLRQQHEDASQQRAGSKRQLEVARRCMEKAIERDMDPALIKQALELFRKIMDESPELSQPYLATAYLSWKMGQPEIAARFLNHLLAINPMSVQAKELLEAVRTESHS